MSLDSKYKIDPAARDDEAIRNAATNGHLDIVKYLMEEVGPEYGIDPAARDDEAIQLSAGDGHLDVVRYLIEEVDSKYRIDPVDMNNEAICVAVEEERKDVVLMGLDPKYGIDRSIGQAFLGRPK